MLLLWFLVFGSIILNFVFAFGVYFHIDPFVVESRILCSFARHQASDFELLRSSVTLSQQKPPFATPKYLSPLTQFPVFGIFGGFELIFQGVFFLLLIF